MKVISSPIPSSSKRISPESHFKYIYLIKQGRELGIARSPSLPIYPLFPGSNYLSFSRTLLQRNVLYFRAVFQISISISFFSVTLSLIKLYLRRNISWYADVTITNSDRELLGDWLRRAQRMVR